MQRCEHNGLGSPFCTFCVEEAKQTPREKHLQAQLDAVTAERDALKADNKKLNELLADMSAANTVWHRQIETPYPGVTGLVLVHDGRLQNGLNSSNLYGR